MSQQQSAVELFDELADSYDAVVVDFFRPIATGLVHEVQPLPGERALDVGCGRGAVLFALASTIGTSGSVTGLDASPRMVQATLDDAERGGFDVEVVVGDAMAPGFPKASFDLITSSLVLFFLPDALAALTTWRELLVEGGRVGVTTFGPDDQRWEEKVDGPLRASAPTEIQESHAEYERGPFMSDEGMERLVVDAGFRNVRTVTSVVSPRFRDADHWFEWSMSLGQRQSWKALSPARRSEVKAAIFAGLEECRDEQGRIGFDQVVRYTIGDR
jgi:ubiquinone/menaquinone biosynthesis C-methylase UbiE